MTAIARQAGINDGKGFLFVSHTGGDFPQRLSGNPGGQRAAHADAYRHSDLFRVLRDGSRLEGKCGGSRSRVYALTGNCLAADPSCVYQPGEAALAARH